MGPKANKDMSLNDLLHTVSAKVDKPGKNAAGSDDAAAADACSTEELLDQCKCPISLELMRRPVLPSSGMLFKIQIIIQLRLSANLVPWH